MSGIIEATGQAGNGTLTTDHYVLLEQRGVLAISGEDARDFLQGLISNDIEKVSDQRAIYAALLSPQGKYLFDFIIAEHGGRLLLETEASRLGTLCQRLTMYKLRAKAEITDVSADFAVVAILGEGAHVAFDLPGDEGSAKVLEGGVAFVDPRYRELGARALLPADTAKAILSAKGLDETDPADYHARRRRLGIPEGSEDLAIDKATLLESGFEELNGVDFAKGCFVGQELTARMKYRALVKKRLMPVTFEGAPPSASSAVTAGEREIGEIRSAARGVGLALLRLDRLAEVVDQNLPLKADGTKVTASRPIWATFDFPDR